MNDDDTTATAIANETPEAPKGKEQTFKVERMIAEAGALGLDPADVAGAFHGVSLNREVTTKQVKDRVQKWLHGEVPAVTPEETT